MLGTCNRHFATQGPLETTLSFALVNSPLTHPHFSLTCQGFFFRTTVFLDLSPSSLARRLFFF